MSSPLVPGLVGLIVGVPIGFQIRSMLAKKSAESRRRAAGGRKIDAEREAKGIIREAEIQARAEVLKAREAFESTIKEQRKQVHDTMTALNKREEVLTQREDNLDRKSEVLDRKEQTIETKAKAVEAAETSVKEREKTAAEATDKAESTLAKLAGMTREQARKDLFDQAREEIQAEMGTFIRRHKEQATAAAENEARAIILGAMQRYAGSHASETMARTVNVSGDEVKGRIIGREGRNIRTLEAATGVSIIIDDTPETVVVSSFDPYRREVAALALEELVASGRIQPTRIEEVVAAVEADMENRLVEIGAEACADVNVNITDNRLLNTLGRLKFRSSFTQNVLQHSREVASLCGMIAGEMGLDTATARKVGLLHDIGKALDQDYQGPHAKIGADFLRTCGETAEIIDGVAGHHGEVENITLYAVLASVADAISSTRPGARSETTRLFVNRIEKLEKLATSLPGVSKAYAIQAGRDLRVVVDPETISDNDALLLARDISTRIENELQYPGQIRVVVIRETRCIEYAH
ncbi:MAG: ribonuclease Y [Kiritimatiellia bacterium]|jgi:ribonuclease Y